jgi:ribosome biogenesis GTPase / thiamine phosphate phosphatase
MTGTVYKSTGSWYIVKDDEGRIWNARIKGIFKIDNITSTNPLAVGDKVEMDFESESENSATITKIHDRKNYVNRQSPKGKHLHHIIAANLDQSLLIATLKDPKTSQGFIDRFLTASEAYHVPAIIVFNKIDIYRQKELDKLAEIKAMYEEIGYHVIPMSVLQNIGVDEVKQILENKTTLISGHSGVGKSTFINSIFPEMNIKTQDVSGWSGKGLHTTTFAEMYDLPTSGRIIDTPGIREFGLVDISRQELSQYFPEMRALINDCQFNNCMHINEPGCAVKEAVENGDINLDRYISYCTIQESIEKKSW